MTGKEAAELQYLEQYYEKAGSQLVVLYGQKNMGMTELVKNFCQDKPSSFYYARPCSEREQRFLWANELRGAGAALLEEASCMELLEAMAVQGSKKSVLVIAEFQNLVRQSEDFMPALLSLLHSHWKDQSMMVLLCSTASGWVENSMVRKIGEAAYEISGFVKMKEQTFFQVAELLPGSTRLQQLEAYAVLGGFPELWAHFESGLSVKENICRHLLRPGSFLHEQALRLVSDELRETNVYHAILSALASGRQKLNELYLRTGYSRAKISVYLKNLMELELVEKVFSYDTAGREHSQKGIYRIQNRLVAFYFRYVYPNMSRLFAMTPEEFYETYIEADFPHFAQTGFGQVCREYMELMNQRNMLPFFYTRSGEWVGKLGTIDIAAQDEEEHTLIGLCNFEKPIMTYEDYEWLVFCAKKAKLHAEYTYLFSPAGFDEGLVRRAKEYSGLRLLDISAF